MKQTEERHSESRMRAIRTSGSMRGSPRRSLAFAPLTPSGSPYSTCAGEAGSHVGESPTGRIRRFTTERDVREEAARLNLQAGHLLNQQAITKVNSI